MIYNQPWQLDIHYGLELSTCLVEKKRMKIRLVPRLIAGVERISLENLDMCTLISLLLVGGLEHLDYFSIYWECHHPNCYSLHHFSEGWRAQPPTNGSWRFSRSRRSGGTSALPALLRFAEKINDWSCAK